jgi:predicted O-methyltransferase YrrM
MLSKIKAGICTVLESGQLLGLDWLNAARRPFWHTARWQLRTLHFRAHCKIPATTLSAICARIGGTSQEVLLASPSFKTEKVGSPEYYFAVAALTRAVQPRNVVEFGTYLGVGTFTLALNAPNATIYTLDLPDTVQSHGSLDSTDIQLVQQSRYRVGEIFAFVPEAERIKQIRCDSQHLRLRNIITSDVDLVLVDGGHSLPVVSADTENALSVLSDRGVIIWDDYWWLYPEVVGYLDRKANELPLQRIEGTNLVVYAPH